MALPAISPQARPVLISSSYVLCEYIIAEHQIDPIDLENVLRPVLVSRTLCTGGLAKTGRFRDADPLRASVKKLHHLVDHLRFVRAVDVMV